MKRIERIMLGFGLVFSLQSSTFAKAMVDKSGGGLFSHEGVAEAGDEGVNIGDAGEAGGDAAPDDGLNRVGEDDIGLFLPHDPVK